MPKLSHETGRRLLSGEDGEQAAWLSLDGFIDAGNYLRFEKALEETANLDCPRAVFDFSRVRYINSTGISALIREHDRYRQRGGTLCLAGVSREVGLSMHLLGVTRVIPFTRDNETAWSYLEDHRAGRAAEPSDAIPAGGPGAPRKVPLRARRVAKDGGSSVLVLAPHDSRFTRVLRRRFRDLKHDRYHLLHDAREALRSWSHLQPDLVVVDDRCDPQGEFVGRIKVQRDGGLTSIIKTYSRDTDVEGSLDFKIWENDFLVDPFDVLEFFALTEAELERVPKDRSVFLQQVRFEFRSSPRNLEKASRLCETILREAFGAQEDHTTFQAAVKEAIDNAHRHGNLSLDQRTVDVNFLVGHRKVTVLVEDEGHGFDYEYYLARVRGKEAFEEAKRRILEGDRRGGLGILLMSRASDHIEYQGSGNVVRLEKALRAS